MEEKRTARVAFIASGGAVKGYAYHIGVLQGLAEDGFHFRAGPVWRPSMGPSGSREINCYVGSSAGAITAASLASGAGLDELRNAVLGESSNRPAFSYRTLFAPVAPNPFNYARRISRRFRHGGLRPHHLLDIGGLFSTEGIRAYLRDHALPSNRFTDLAAEVYIVATQLNMSRKVIFGPLDSVSEGSYNPYCAYYNNIGIAEAVAASAAVPPLFAPYKIVNPINGKPFYYYDGEVRETLSLHVARDVGADFVIASSVWQPYNWSDSVGSLSDYGMSTIALQALQHAIEQKVDQYQRQSALYDQVIDDLRARDARFGIPRQETESYLEQLCQQLHHRSIHTLYVLPDRKDHDLFFAGWFSLKRKFIEYCIEAGYRAYRRQARQQPDFFEHLDRCVGRSGESKTGP